MYKFKAITILKSQKDLFVELDIPILMRMRNTKNAKNILKRENNDGELPYQL